MKISMRSMCAVLALAAPSLAFCAVTVPGPDRLPADTWVLVDWHGVANATKVGKTNPVMQLWHDPQFVAARDQILTSLISALHVPPADARASVEDVLSLLENPLVFGVAGDPLAGSGHLYAVLNKKGKQAEWDRLRAREKPGANSVVSTYELHGVQVRKSVVTVMPAAPAAPAAAGAMPVAPQQPKVSTTLEASLGDYQLFASDASVMEALITRLQDGGKDGDSLTKSAAYQRAQKFRAKGALLEAFVKVPDLSRVAAMASPQIQAVMHELHPERVQGLWLSAGMERDRTPVRAALIADTAPGSLLDVIGANVADFQTTAVAPAAESYSAVRIDLPALYAVAMRAVKAAMQPDQGAAISMMIDGAVAGQTGMRTTDLLGLFSGEIGMVGSEVIPPAGAALPLTILLPVMGEQVSNVLHKVAAPLFANEEKVSGASVVAVGPFAAAAPNALAGGGGPRNLLEKFFVGVSPTLLAASASHEDLAAVLARDAAHAPAPPGSVAADAKFREARKFLPTQLNSIAYTDFSRVDWNAYLHALQESQAKSRQEAEATADRIEKGSDTMPPDPVSAARLRDQQQLAAGFMKMLLDIMPLTGKYLKTSIGGSWKAADGVFFDSYVN